MLHACQKTSKKVTICWLLGNDTVFPPVFTDLDRNGIYFDTCPCYSSLGRLFLLFMFILKVQMQRTGAVAVLASNIKKTSTYTVR
jgi:hypothetical protein